ncbi:hypothetical protein BV20DRAFT_820072 [Pilatotrama ljubarskyi]|nr:hypothetical protein BV20DRAFT_820072 [Pilatotrama ljubarskyi]
MLVLHPRRRRLTVLQAVPLRFTVVPQRASPDDVRSSGRPCRPIPADRWAHTCVPDALRSSRMCAKARETHTFGESLHRTWWNCRSDISHPEPTDTMSRCFLSLRTELYIGPSVPVHVQQLNTLQEDRAH